jgi:anti-sigma B factor antagonist
VHLRDSAKIGSSTRTADQEKPMRFSVTEAESEAVLSIEGQLDALTAPSLTDTLDSLVGGGRRSILVDLSKLRIIDSSGVGALVSLYKRVRAAGRDMSVVGVRAQPLAIFRLLGLDRILISPRTMSESGER